MIVNVENLERNELYVKDDIQPNEFINIFTSNCMKSWTTLLQMPKTLK
jgi:hypothetical protein